MLRDRYLNVQEATEAWARRLVAKKAIHPGFYCGMCRGIGRLLARRANRRQRRAPVEKE